MSSVEVVYIRVHEGEYHSSLFVHELVTLDFDSEGQILGIELAGKPGSGLEKVKVTTYDESPRWLRG